MAGFCDHSNLDEIPRQAAIESIAKRNETVPT
jgi:hypothetical protein